MNLPVKALTLHGPWAWAIVNGYKCVENREWYTEHRGPIFIHSGQSLESDESAEQILMQLGCPLPDGYPRGAIIGSVEITEVLPLVDYLQKYGDRPRAKEMAIGPWCWVLENPKRCEPVPHPGNFQLWRVNVLPEIFVFHDPEPENKPESESNAKEITQDHRPAMLTLQEIFERLLKHYGPQKWWPAESPLEVIIGLILVRNSQWPVASRVVGGLKNSGLLTLDRLQKISDDALLEKIRPVGRQKAKVAVIRQLVGHLCKTWNGQLMPFLSRPTETVRNELLAISGIGPETADMILLYAANHPVCPIDDYTKRVLVRHGMLEQNESSDNKKDMKKSSIEQMQQLFYEAFDRDTAVFNELHALLVQVGREFCLKSAPHCESCPLSSVGK